MQYNKNSLQHGKIVQYKTTKTDLQDCRVEVTIDIDEDNNHLAYSFFKVKDYVSPRVRYSIIEPHRKKGSVLSNLFVVLLN